MFNSNIGYNNVGYDSIGYDQISVGYADINPIYIADKENNRETHLLDKIKSFGLDDKLNTSAAMTSSSQPVSQMGGSAPNVAYSKDTSEYIDSAIRTIRTDPQKESFTDYINDYDEEYLTELLEKKNNMLIALIFFLCVIIIIQYYKNMCLNVANPSSDNEIKQEPVEPEFYS